MQFETLAIVHKEDANKPVMGIRKVGIVAVGLSRGHRYRHYPGVMTIFFFACLLILFACLAVSWNPAVESGLIAALQFLQE